ncbi:PaaI family thioesterase [Streptomyces gilvus]|uniref:PaaI family thioesterase n=1 Tax=Streptomyces gilvus TaxID=2920937 RepID=UPI001F10222E|nr:PaaI family thioesterase [Streptomyces sp. CME 23]MCH5675587.1 PaaI family thioesterase [Streptomyces sp. CME 23]
MTEHLASMAERVNRLANAARISRAPNDVVDQVCSLTRQAEALLEQYAWAGPYAVEQLAPPDQDMLVWEPDDLRRTIPYSPILGNLSPTAGRTKVWADGDDVEGSVTLSPIHAGPMGTVHGGIVAAVLDELTSLAILASGNVGYTRSMTVTYRRPTPLGSELSLWAKTAGRAGDVFMTSAEIRHAGQVTASAVTLHHAAGRRDEPIYRKARDDRPARVARGGHIGGAGAPQHQ